MFFFTLHKPAGANDSIKQKWINKQNLQTTYQLQNNKVLSIKADLWNIEFVVSQNPKSYK